MLDLKSVNWLVPIYPCFRKFLAFQGGTRSVQVMVLPFGFNMSPRVVIKLPEEVRTVLVCQGVDVIMYLDDWLILAPSQPATW